MFSSLQLVFELSSVMILTSLRFFMNSFLSSPSTPADEQCSMKDGLKEEILWRFRNLRLDKRSKQMAQTPEPLER